MKKKFLVIIYKRLYNKLAGKGLRKIPGVTITKRFLTNRLKSDFAIVQDHKMFLGRKDSLKLSLNGIYEEVETGLVKKHVSRGNNVIDVGANIGYYSLIFAKLVGNDGFVFSFEPEPSNINLLKKNIQINNYTNVKIENCAVGKKNGKIKLYLSNLTTGMHRIYKSKFCAEKFVEVSLIKLDDYFKNSVFLKKISFVKIDVEGAEFDVLRGMSLILESNHHICLLVEFVPDSIKEYGERPEDLLEFLFSKNFKIYCIDDQEKTYKNYNLTNNIITTFPNGTNLFCIRK